MRIQTVCTSVFLFAVVAIGAHVFSDESAGDGELVAEVARLNNEVSELRRQVDYLMVDHESDQSDIDALAEHVRLAHQVSARVKALYEHTRGTSDQLHQSNYDLRLAMARLAFAKKDYKMAVAQMDSALEESQRVSEILNSRFDAGTVTLSNVLAAQLAAVDARLKRNQFKRKIELLTADSK